MLAHLKHGLDLKLATPPAQVIADSKPSSTSTLLGSDYPGIKPRLLVEEGAVVRAGEAIFCDRVRPQIIATAPVSGTLSAINRGAKRSLIFCEITAQDVADGIGFEIPAVLDRAAVRGLMLQSGLWTTLRKRPFGYIPYPEKDPRALLVTAIDTQPLAPDPAVVIDAYSAEFSAGLKALCELVEAPLYLCQAAQASIQIDESLPVRRAGFAAAHPAGLPGVHIHRLCPIGFDGDEVWHISYQNVISLGCLIKTGKPWYQRVVSLAGMAVKNPRLLKLPLGASITEVIAGELHEGSERAISGSVFSGYLATGVQASLAALHHQITVIIAAEHQGRSSLIALPELDTVAPPGVLATPLLRALVVGDVEQARDLGALELVEEDLALLSYVCSSGTDYGALLRPMLDQIEREGLSIRQ
ncbi:MAG: NADH:ubiquinone reductase (Na(+)-transporting) subunit A [Gammaproteobacteria bacterium]|nr:NADH:ubiquinone reductase (Na(+)-transporting) subunit A [Gammaproteobacteria bacterium]